MHDGIARALERTRELILEGRFPEAFQELAVAKAMPPLSPEVLVLLAQITWHSGEPGRHLEHLRYMAEQGRKRRALELSLDFLHRNDADEHRARPIVGSVGSIWT